MRPRDTGGCRLQKTRCQRSGRTLGVAVVSRGCCLTGGRPTIYRVGAERSIADYSDDDAGRRIVCVARGLDDGRRPGQLAFCARNTSTPSLGAQRSASFCQWVRIRRLVGTMTSHPLSSAPSSLGRCSRAVTCSILPKHVVGGSEILGAVPCRLVRGIEWVPKES